MAWVAGFPQGLSLAEAMRLCDLIPCALAYRQMPVLAQSSQA